MKTAVKIWKKAEESGAVEAEVKFRPRIDSSNRLVASSPSADHAYDFPTIDKSNSFRKKLEGVLGIKPFDGVSGVKPPAEYGQTRVYISNQPVAVDRLTRAKILAVTSGLRVKDVAKAISSHFRPKKLSCGYEPKKYDFTSGRSGNTWSQAKNKFSTEMDKILQPQFEEMKKPPVAPGKK